MPQPERSARRPLDAAALARVTQRLQGADEAPWLHGEVARRMAERLAVIRLQPAQVLDWHSFVGASHDTLRNAYPQARVMAVEARAARRDATAAALEAPWWSPRRWGAHGPRALCVDDVAPGAGQLLWANMSLHGALDPQAEMAVWHRAVAVDGFLMFSTLGPGSLAPLRALYRDAGWPAPFAPFVDMHDLGDMLVAAGFADPVMDQEDIVLTWASGAALLAELRSLGGNVDPARMPGLRTPRWQHRLATLIEDRLGRAGRVELPFEVVYGHAFRPAPRPKVAARTEVPLDDLRAMVRSGRSRT